MSSPAQEQPYQILPPPEQSFDTKEELVTFSKDWALSQGYGIATHSAMAFEQCFAYRCLSGNTSSTKHALKTKKTGCGFRFTGNFYKKVGKCQPATIQSQLT